MDDLVAAIRELTRVTEEQLRWQKATAMPVLRDELASALTSEKKRTVYRLVDGTHTFREISQQAGVALGTVSAWVKAWKAQGLVVEIDGGLRHLIGPEAAAMLASTSTRAGTES